MMNFYKKIGTLVLVLCTATLALGQANSYKILSDELQALQKQLVPDKRVAILVVELKAPLAPAIVVKGETDLPEAKKQIIQFLANKKVAFTDSIKLLPDASLGDKTWALATLSVSNIRYLPDHASELVSQALLGTPMKVLEVKDNWVRVQTPEKYIGWMDTGGLQRLDQTELERWKKANRYIFKHITGNVLAAPKKKSELVSDVVLGDLFEVEAKVKGYLKIKFPDGRIGYVRKSQCQSFDDWSQTAPNAQAVISIAKQMMGFPYLWGGTSTKGIDCSGFMKIAYYSQGVVIARDASQQAKYGQPIDFSDIDNLQPGDLLFFGRSAQRITHVGLYLDKGDFIHSSGRVHVSSIVPSDPKYLPTRKNVAACRLLNSLDTAGIIRVKNHPWYVVHP